MTEHVDDELLRVVAHAALQSTERLLGEGLHPEVLETVLVHVQELAGGRDPAALSRAATHAVGLRDALQGPTSATLLAWLDDALGLRP